MPSISFITANYVARTMKYSGGAAGDWGKFDQHTRANVTGEHFFDLARDVSEAGFDAIDIWDAHCDWRRAGKEDDIEQVKGACSQFDLAISSYAGGLNAQDAGQIEKLFKFMRQLGTHCFAGGVWGANLPELWPGVQKLAEPMGMKFAFENHPEKSVEEILGKIDGGKWANVGVALDTGWCGTQGIDALEAAMRLREKEKLLLVHLKDVTAVGGHETCALGEGVVAVDKVVQFLVKSGWKGTFCIEHEPFDRDPMPEVMISLQRVKQWMK